MAKIEREYKVDLQFQPSVREVREAPPDAYMGGLDEFYGSVRKLLEYMEHESSKVRVIRHPIGKPMFKEN